MKTNFIPRSDVQFNEWQKNLITFLKTNAAVLGIPAETITKLENEQAEFEKSFAIADNPATRTHGTIITKDESRSTFESSIRITVKAYVTYNPAVTDEQRINAGLPVHKTSRTPIPVPSTFPECTVETALRRITIHFRDAGSDKKKKPAGINGAVIYWAILDAAPSNVDMLINSVFDTASPYSLDFTEGQRGSRVYFCLAWQNTKGERGPWSEIGMAIVP